MKRIRFGLLPASVAQNVSDEISTIIYSEFRA